MEEPLGMKHWVVVTIVVILIISMLGLVRGPKRRVRVTDSREVPVASVGRSA